ncbi:hypothetical protein CDO73_08825 [Saccharibacillus sp. O23]|uniref:sensor histidine kinase n=1 Tax=Saccharibacillus sp. O23 TaxID=2009338 RepID=UPI000B4E114F|nr:sensor histidine kinase [Saccharibacillus sp. O23]OWR30691.1 hypothetical protein CDO73_08825 [Saccharibacillus sp. O23]
MKLFLRSHLMLIGFMLVQLLLVLLVFWFDGYSHTGTLLYAGFLGLLVLAGYLAVRYVSMRGFYRRLSKPYPKLLDAPEEIGSAALSRALEELLDDYYRQTQERLRSWERQREERLQFMNQWVHQMKTPLAVIELLTQEADDEQADSIAEEAERLRKGLEMVLSMSRLERFEQDFRVEKVELREAVGETVSEFKRLFIRSRVYPENKVEAELTVETDAKWLRFMLQQLLSNAIKYSAGSGTAVKISTVRLGRSVLLEVSDRGVGIPKQDLGRVFRPFFTGENGRSFKESTGMGLYLVQEAAGRLNHRVSIESEQGQGTTVRVEFPFAGDSE